MRGHFDIYYVLDGKDIGARIGQLAVPRNGDEVMIHRPDGIRQYPVVKVVWGVAPDDRTVCTVNVHLAENGSAA